MISGRAYARVTHVGDENYTNSLINEVRQEKRVHSELLDSMRKVTRFTSFLIIPLGVLLFVEAMFLRHSGTYDAVVSSAAALLGMLPKGLVLLISVSLATGVIRLAKAKILVQNIYSLETLAHVDVLCLDKTGTLTDGNMSVDRIVPLGERGAAEDSDALLRAYLDASEDNNVTIAALRAHFGADGSTTDAGQPAAPAGDGRHPVLVEAQMGRHHDARNGWCGIRASPRAGGRVGCGCDRNRVPGRPGAHPWREPAR